MTTLNELEIAKQEWIALARECTWDLPATDERWIAKCAAHDRYLSLALAPLNKTPETPLLPATCPVKETGRKSGVIGYVCASYGYIRVEGEDDVKFFPRHVFGNVPMKGDIVTFERGITGNALNVVLEGAATSREAYSAKMQQRPAMPPVRRGRATDGGGFQFTENADELNAARDAVRKLRGG